MKGKKRILVCKGTGCVSGGSDQIFSLLEDALDVNGSHEKIELRHTGCHGFCQQGPLIVIEPEGIFYTKATAEDISHIVKSVQPRGKPVKRLFYKDLDNGKPISHYHDIPFYSKQERTILRYCGVIDPEDIEEYLSVGGYEALKKVLRDKEPQKVIEQVKKSGLRGLGGAGFPTGRKWEACRNADGETKYVVCNADEGDPGAFQDRSVMEGNPHSVIEGMIIAAYAVGAEKGFIYVRAEYPFAVKRLKIAIEQAEREGFLGKSICDMDFDFHLNIFQGAGAFVCGESTALVRSIEGKRGWPKPMPRARTTDEGLWNKPTLLNNVKTYANIPLVILKGPKWFASRGTEKSKGTAVFSLTGKVTNCGLIEVPMGITLRKIIYEIGGGVLEGKALKAVQTGGPSGGCLPADMIDMPVDFDSLTKAGSIMGSGGLVVMDEETCMVDVARYFLDFNQRESCGQCIPCRLGTKQMFEILNDITKGQGRAEDIDLLLELSGSIQRSSICGLGKTAPNPVLTTIQYFKDEYKAHIADKKCPAGICQMG
jgi:NADH:ubiquinone oxidoreductase subunit F (NADH-binding)/(2Fe-2S) ferredoxin